MAIKPRDGRPRRMLVLFAFSAVAWSASVSGTEGSASVDDSAAAAESQDVFPISAWLARAGVRLDDPRAAALGLPILIASAAVATVIAAWTASREYGGRAGIWTATAMLLSGRFGPAGSSFTIADSPAWLAWLVASDRLSALADNYGRRTRDWVVALLAIVAVLAFHPLALLLISGAFLGLATQNHQRIPIRLGAILATFSGVVLWFVTQPGANSPTWAVWTASRNFYIQAMLMLPWIWLPLVGVFAGGCWLGFGSNQGQNSSGGERIRLGIAAVVCAVWFVQSGRRPLPPTSGLIGLATLFPDLGGRWDRALRRPKGRVVGAAGLQPRLAVYTGLSIAIGWLGPSRIERPHPSRGAKGGDYAYRSLLVGGYRWTYAVYDPNSVEPGAIRPALILLPGSGGRGSRLLKEAGWDVEADRRGFLVVAPDGLPLLPWRPPHRFFNPRVWNSGRGDPKEPRNRVDDLAFLDAILADLAARGDVDPARITVVGHSVGGSMAYRVAAERADRIAGIAAVSATPPPGLPTPTRTIPTLGILGTKDIVSPPAGGLSLLPWDARWVEPASLSLGRWSLSIGGWTIPCDYDVAQDGSKIVKYYGPSPNDRRMAVILLPDHGHAWPGADGQVLERLLSPTLTPRDSIDATATIGGFLDEQVWPSALGN